MTVGSNQLVVDQLLGAFKQQVMMLLNETADEFEEMELTDDQKEIYNRFTAAFGQKVLSLKAIMK